MICIQPNSRLHFETLKVEVCVAWGASSKFLQIVGTRAGETGEGVRGGGGGGGVRGLPLVLHVVNLSGGC